MVKTAEKYFVILSISLENLFYQLLIYILDFVSLRVLFIRYVSSYFLLFVSIIE